MSSVVKAIFEKKTNFKCNIQNSLFSKIPFKSTTRLSNSSLPNQPRHFVGPDLGLNCMQKVLADKELKYLHTT